MNKQDFFLIEKTGRIMYREKRTDLTSQELISTASGLYLKACCWGKIFGLNCEFKHRDLCVELTTELDLPVIKEMKQQRLREMINRLKGNVKVDSVIGRNSTGCNIAAADWSIAATQQQQGANNLSLNLALGGMVAGGETNLLLNYTNNRQLDLRNQQFIWRYVQNDNPVVRQVSAGRVYTPTVASVLFPIAGVQVSNTPTFNRTAFGTYRLTDITEPGWKVELYINHELIDYQQADASGFYSFNVPIIYGNTSILLRFYGPWGEEYSRQKDITVPFNFLPAKDFEYSVTAGIELDTFYSRFATARLHYGLTQRLTVGGGIEYLSSLSSGNNIPFVQASYRLPGNMVLSSEYAYQVRSKTSLFWRSKSDMEIELTYLRYQKDQQAVLYNYLEERKISFSLPVRREDFSLLSKLTVDQIKMPVLQQAGEKGLSLPPMEFTTAEWVCAGSIGSINTNLTTFCNFRKGYKTIAYSNLSQTYRVFDRMLFTPRLQYAYDRNQITNAKIELERPIASHGFVRFTLERDFYSQQFTTGIMLRYDFSFAKTGFSANISGHGSSISQSAGGSFLFDRATNYLDANNLGSVGRAQFIIQAFLDLDGNGKKDPGEPKVEGVIPQLNGGVVQYYKEDTLCRVFSLEPYRKYIVTVNPDGLSSISWRVKNPSISVLALPNQFKLVEIPIEVYGEVSGAVKNEKLQGLGRIKVNVYDAASKLVTSILTEGDGYFSYLGLTPGSYTISVDAEQMKRLNLKATPAFTAIKVKRSMEGDVVDGLSFTLTSQDMEAPPDKSVGIHEISEYTPKNSDAHHTKCSLFNF
ncbi:carboxypeptidase-like regulatory domain-containing protein [Chitinophaga sp. HK235]|uniref:carboxypeptidase-like regulatory domain-containing protein n=1 Tax=Chitinophaga sp. HK235 TaxID=2952571 RepID=UPI001BA6FFD6|nr:carboxypeptidase-like regulatory domain-containing protein [Chitinophaga sp. HK235]